MKKSDVATARDCLQSSTTALRRVAQFVNSQSWARWCTFLLTPTQQRILEVLSRLPGGVSLTRVAFELSITPATVSDSIGSPVRKGLVLRQSSRVDGRMLSLTLTHAGTDRFEMLASQPDPLRDVLATLPGSDQEVFSSLMAKVVSKLE